MRRLLASLGQGVDQDAARRRAESLLEDSLTPEQLVSYRSHGYVVVPSSTTPERTYRVDGWRPVGVYERGRFVGAVCIRPKESMPAPDVVLARKLLIEGAEEEFLRVGNWLAPAWRPAGLTPTVLLLLVLVGPWALHLRALGPIGLGIGAALLALPVVLLAWRRRVARAFEAEGTTSSRSSQGIGPRE